MSEEQKDVTMEEAGAAEEVPKEVSLVNKTETSPSCNLNSDSNFMNPILHY
jgi:hypothetical protein